MQEFLLSTSPILWYNYYDYRSLSLQFIIHTLIIIYYSILFEGAILQWSLYSSNVGNKLWCFSWLFSSVQNLLWDGSIFLSFHGTEYWCQFREGLPSRFKQWVCIEDPGWSWIIFACTAWPLQINLHMVLLQWIHPSNIPRTACLISVQHYRLSLTWNLRWKHFRTLI